MDQQPPVRRHASFQGYIGIARADITPPRDIYARNWGAARHDTANSIHRRLTLTALTIASSSDDDPLVLIDADLGWWRPLDVFTQFQERLVGRAFARFFTLSLRPVSHACRPRR